MIVFPQYEDFSVMLISFPCIFSPLIVYSDPLSELTRKPDTISVKMDAKPKRNRMAVNNTCASNNLLFIGIFFFYIFKEISFIYLKWLNVRLLLNFQRMWSFMYEYSQSKCVNWNKVALKLIILYCFDKNKAILHSCSKTFNSLLFRQKKNAILINFTRWMI